MAAPAFQAKGTKGDTTTNTCTFTYPTVAANDLLFLMIYDNGSGGNINVSNKWTLIQQKINWGDSNLKKSFLFGTIATGSESGTENITRTSVINSGKRFSAQIYSYRGDSYLIYESGNSNTGINDTITWSSITIGGSARTLAAFVINCIEGNPGVPTGYTSSAVDTLGDASYFELNTNANVSLAPSVTTINGNQTEGWCTFHISMYNNTPVAGGLIRTFIIN